MSAAPTWMQCAGCGYVAPPDEPRPFRCPRAKEGDDVDHVLRRHLDPELAVPGGAEERRRLFLDDEPQSFVRYRRLLHGYHAARALGFDDDGVVDLIRQLDDRVAAVDGHGFSETPFAREPSLGEAMPTPAKATQAMAAAKPPRRLSLALAIVVLLIAALAISVVYFVNRSSQSETDSRNPSTTETTTFDVTG